MSPTPDENPSVSDASEQLGHAIETFRFLFDLMAKVWTFLVAVNGVVLGFGIVSKSSGPIFIGALIMLVATLLPSRIGRSAAPLAYAAYVAEKDLRRNRPGIVEIYGRTVSPRWLEDFERIRCLKGRAEVVELRNLSRGSRFLGWRLSLLIGAVFVGELVLAIYFASNGAPFFDLNPLEVPSTPSTPAP